MALVASVLIWAPPTQAQQQPNVPPIAIADLGDPTTADDVTTQPLNGSGSIDPDNGGTVCTDCEYEWEVVTDAYSWLQIANDDMAVASFVVPEAQLAARYGLSIEFRLTVTDSREASASDTVTYSFNQGPTADITVEANLEDRASDEEGADRYTVDAVIDGPGENGNADNEWDVMEGALLVLDGSGSSDPNGRVGTYTWALIFPADAANGLADDDTGKTLSTDVADTDGVETLDDINEDQSPLYAYYTLVVTDNDGLSSPQSVVKIVVHDQPAAPKASLFATTAVDDGDNTTPADAGGDEVDQAFALLDDDIPVNNAMAYGDLQESRFPTANPTFIVSPDTTISLDASQTSDADDRDDVDDDGDSDTASAEDTSIASYEWDGAKAETARQTRAILKIDKDAEDGTVITVTVTATDNTGLSGSTSIDFKVVDDNTVPDASTGSRDDCAATLQTGEAQNCTDLREASANLVGGNQYVTKDGAQGGDVKNNRPTGRVTFRGVGFDPDQPVGSLIYAWGELACLLNSTNGAGDTADQAVLDQDNFCLPVDPDKAILELEDAGTNTVSFAVPEVEEAMIVWLVFAVIDQHGVTGIDTVTIFINPANSKPVADAGSDAIVQPGDFVRLNGVGSSDPDKDDSIASYSWRLTKVVTSPDTTEVLKSVADQVTKDLTAAGILPLVEDNDDGVGNDDGVIDAGETSRYPDILTGSITAYPYFDAPKVANGIANIQLTFTLTVTDNVGLTNSKSVTVTVTNKFFSGDVTGPNFCSNASLGGPKTYAFDSDGDGVADVCSLQTTRRATVASQNAMNTLIAIGSTLSRTDKGNDGEPDAADGTQDDRTSAASFADLVLGRAGVTAITEIGDDPDTDATETDAAVRDAVSAVTGTCDTPGLNKLGDSAADLAADACTIKRVSGPPAPVDPAKADVFFAGVITGPNYCTDASLGGRQTYAFDSDDDGVADVCSLPYTRREAVARQVALEMFKAHGQYDAALAAACTALGTTDFGDSEAALAKDECNPEARQPDRGGELPTPG